MRIKTILTLLMLSSSSFALLNIVSPIPDYTYFSNENVLLLGNLGFNKCSGTAILFLDGKELEKSTFNKGLSYKLEDLFSNNSFNLNSGGHYITITTDCGDKKTVYFKVKNKLSIVYSTNGNKFMTGDEFKISAYAFEKEKITNITKITIGNKSFIDTASIVFKKPENITVGMKAESKEGYTAEKSITIQIFDNLKIDAKVERRELKPGDNGSINVLCFDAFGKMRKCNASVYWFGEWASLNSLIVPNNASPGEYAIKIIASNGSNKGEESINITVLREVVIKDVIVNGDEFEVVGTDQNGNSFNTEVNISFFDSNGRFVKEKRVLTNNKYKINLPPGTYYIVMNASGKSFEKKAALGNSEAGTNELSGFVVAKKRATLIAGLVIVVLTVIAVLLQRKKY